MSYGTAGVDYESRVDFDRLRKERLKKAKEQLRSRDLGALLCFDPDNIRYITSTHAPMWTREKMTRYCVLPRDGEPILFEVGSLALARKESHGANWLEGRIRPAISWGRGAVPIEVNAAKACSLSIKEVLDDNNVSDEKLGIDICDIPILRALNSAKIDVADGQAPMLDARLIKTQDEIELLKTAAMMVDSAFDMVAKAIRPGIRESDLVALVNHTLYSMGSDQVQNVNAESGPRTNPHHHDFSDRAIRPGDVVFLDIQHSFNGYMTCYYRTFVCGKSTQQQRDLYRECLDWLEASIKIVRPEVTTADIAKCWPGPEVLGLKTEQEALANQWGHGIGLSLWELPLISRAFSIDYPFAVKENMVFALETYAGTKGGKYGIRIEEEIVVTNSGYEVITKYPDDELISCGV
jgi:Xaa-Pro aminopeptidase